MNQFVDLDRKILNRPGQVVLATSPCVSLHTPRGNKTLKQPKPSKNLNRQHSRSKRSILNLKERYTNLFLSSLSLTIYSLSIYLSQSLPTSPLSLIPSLSLFTMNNKNNPEEDMANEQQINRKRKGISHENNPTNLQIPRSRFSDNLQEHDDENDVLTLSLSFRPTTRHRSHQEPPASPSQSVQPLLSQPPTLNAPQLSPSHPLYINPFPTNYTHGHSSHVAPPPPLSVLPPPPSPSQQQRSTGPTRTRRNLTQYGKSDIVPQPYPWATTLRATVHSLTYLELEQIVTITGDVQCKRCEKQYEMDFDLREKFYEVGSFIVKNRGTMHDRAPSVWMNPILPTCKFCDQENSLKPIISEKKKAINWLFLLLGQMLGCCTLEQLKYFCKHTKNHRTGAKDRVLYLTYLGICKQLDPKGPFDR